MDETTKLDSLCCMKLDEWDAQGRLGGTVSSFDLSQEHAQARDQWRLIIKGAIIQGRSYLAPFH